jgi:hypothetical protein
MKIVVDKRPNTVKVMFAGKQCVVKTDHLFVTDNFDFAVWLVLLYAIVNQIEIEIDEPVTSDLVFNVDVLQMYLSRHLNLGKINLRAGNIVDSRLTSEELLMPFSGGVDACFSLFYNLNELNRVINSVVVIKGFDVFSDEQFRLMQKRCCKILKSTTTNVISLDLAYDEFRCMDWRFQSNFVLGGLLHLFDGRFGYGFISGTGDGGFLSIERCFKGRYLNERLFHLFGNRAMIVDAFEGANHTKVQKINYLATQPEVLENLRVCWVKQRHDNCGKCEKCVLTQLGFLASTGAIPPCFDRQMREHDLDRLIKKVQSSNESFYGSRFKEIVELAARKGRLHPFLRRLPQILML